MDDLSDRWSASTDEEAKALSADLDLELTDCDPLDRSMPLMSPDWSGDDVQFQLAGSVLASAIVNPA